MSRSTNVLFFASVVLTACFPSGCEISDEERCPAGYTFHTESRTCLDNDELALPDAVTPDVMTDSQDVDESDVSEVTGMGESCSQSEDCAAYDADFCAINPLTQEGSCTIADCVSGGCPDDTLCCDCSEVELLAWVICMDGDSAAQATAIGCVCE